MKCTDYLTDSQCLAKDFRFDMDFFLYSKLYNIFTTIDASGVSAYQLYYGNHHSYALYCSVLAEDAE